MTIRSSPGVLLAALLLAAPASAQPFATAHNIVRVGRKADGAGAKTTAAFNPVLEPFYHGVASGDPTSGSVMLWTRVTPASPSVTSISGTWQLAADTGFAALVTTGTFTTTDAQDYTVRIDVSGLSAGSTYYYRFTSGGKYSLVGRAKTVPAGSTPASSQHLKFGVVSCSNYEGGYFNAYGALAVRNDLDAVIHLGDYIYEYGAGTYGGALTGRVNEPSTEILTLSDYRTRYSLYRLDPDLIRLHQQHTFLTIWDDHESANDSYTDGAENHNPATEGLWSVRKATAKRVYREWMPIRDTAGGTVYRKVSYGELADVLLLDTRLEGRVQPPPHYDSPDTGAVPRRIISSAQQSWLTDNLKASSARWKVVGNQVLYSVFNVGFAGGFSDGIPNPTNADSIRAAEDLFIDNWESYPRQRQAVLDTLKAVPNVAFITGDSHCTWAFDIPDSPVTYPNPLASNLPTPVPYNATTKKGYNGMTQEGSWAVEYGTPSISSPNFDEAVGPAVTAQFETAMNNPLTPLGGVNYNPHCRGVDLDRHGFFILDLRADSLHADFFYVSAVDTTAYTLQTGPAFRTDYNSNKVRTASGPAPGKTTTDVPTPVAPQAFASGVNETRGPVIFGVYPNPASSELFVHLGVQAAGVVEVQLYSLDGRLLGVPVPAQPRAAGVYNLRFSLGAARASGTYIIRVTGGGSEVSFPVQVLR